MSDSRIETYKHIQNVQLFLNSIIMNLMIRGLEHDKSKLIEPEVSIFDEVTDKLSELEYGTQEYRNMLEQIKPATEHHYSVNSHHPEYYKNGISGMSLIDIVEMLCDWKAATLRHNTGDIVKSIEINQKRFGYSDELKQILLNTIDLI